MKVCDILLLGRFSAIDLAALEPFSASEMKTLTDVLWGFQMPCGVIHEQICLLIQ